MKKRLLSLLIAVLIITSSLPLAALPVYAAEYSGSCGENVTWQLDTETCILTISGSGPMNDYTGGLNTGMLHRGQTIIHLLNMWLLQMVLLILVKILFVMSIHQPLHYLTA